MKVTLSLIAGFLAALLLTTAAMAQAPLHPAGAKYSDGTISFSYPSKLKKASHKTASALGQQLLGNANHMSLADVGVVLHENKKKTKGEVVVMAKISLDRKLQKHYKGHHALILKKFLKGIKKGSGVQVISQKNTKFGGQPGKEIEVKIASSTGKSRDSYWVSVAKNGKSMYLGVFIAVPAKRWAKDASTFQHIAHSAKFH